jgi:hypothetical protein
MIKHFCDNCESEINNYSVERLARQYGNIKIQISVAWKGVWNSGHLCAPCIIEAVKLGIEPYAPLIVPPPVPPEKSVNIDDTREDDAPF